MTLQSVSQVNNKLSNPFTSTGVVTLSFIHGDRAAHPLSCWNCCLWTILDLKMPTTLSFTVHSLALVFRREGKEKRLCAKGAAFFNKWDTSKLKMRLTKWKMKKGTPAECRASSSLDHSICTWFLNHAWVKGDDLSTQRSCLISGDGHVRLRRSTYTGERHKNYAVLILFPCRWA